MKHTPSISKRLYYTTLLIDCAILTSLGLVTAVAASFGALPEVLYSCSYVPAQYIANAGTVYLGYIFAPLNFAFIIRQLRCRRETPATSTKLLFTLYLGLALWSMKIAGIWLWAVFWKGDNLEFDLNWKNGVEATLDCIVLILEATTLKCYTSFLDPLVLWVDEFGGEGFAGGLTEQGVIANDDETWIKNQTHDSKLPLGTVGAEKQNMSSQGEQNV